MVSDDVANVSEIKNLLKLVLRCQKVLYIFFFTGWLWPFLDLGDVSLAVAGGQLGEPCDVPETSHKDDWHNVDGRGEWTEPGKTMEIS